MDIGVTEVQGAEDVGLGLCLCRSSSEDNVENKVASA